MFTWEERIKMLWRTKNNPNQPSTYGQHYQTQPRKGSNERRKGSGSAQIIQERSVDSLKSPPKLSQSNYGKYGQLKSKPKVLKIAGLSEADEEGRWVTINGTHVLIKDGESVGDAFKHTTGKDLDSSAKVSDSKQDAGRTAKNINTGSDKDSGEGKQSMTRTASQIKDMEGTWDKEGAHLDDAKFGNGIVSYTPEEFAKKFPTAKFTRDGKFGLEAEVEVEYEGVKMKDTYSIWASRNPVEPKRCRNEKTK